MKKKLFSKFRDYNYILDKVLGEKNFSEDATNLLLNMVYKIEVSYKDYSQIKGIYQKQNDFIDGIINIISEDCNQLFLVDPKREEVKMLKEKNVLALTSEKEKKVYAYPTELAILYGIVDIKPKYFYIPRKYYYLKRQFQDILVQGTLLNYTEVIRNFNGWSWNLAEDANIDHVSNMIYQAIRMLIDEDFLNAWEQDTSPKTDYIDRLRKELAEYYGKENSKNFYIAMARLIIANTAKQNREKIKEELDRVIIAYENMKDKTTYIYKVSTERKKLIYEIEKKDKILNNNKALVAEFARRNRALPPDNQILNLSILADILQSEREECVKRINELNELVKPSNYTQLKGELAEKISILSVINERKTLRDYSIAFQKEVIRCFAANLEKMTLKEEFIDIIYRMRYYRKIRITENEKVEDIPVLFDGVTRILKYVITKGCQQRFFNIYCNDIEYNYRIIEIALNTAISDYEYADISLKFKDGILEVTVYDNDVIDRQEEIEFPFSPKELTKQKKKISLYVM